MRQSKLFTKTLRSAPKDELSRNAQYLVRGGFVDKLMAGVYTLLPLGLAVLRRIEAIIREEMNAVGGQEILMPALHPLANYRATGREKIDVLYHLDTDRTQDMVLGQSHEEVVVPLVKKYISSYRDLPFSVYQIQTKFRNELRPKSGIFRGREFIMKDLYSFHADEKDLAEYYEKVREAYQKIFARVGIGEKTYYTYASGGTFSEFSHEFQTLTAAGEDIIHICRHCRNAVNEEIVEKVGRVCPACGAGEFTQEKAIEVGNIFPLHSRFSDAFNLTYTDAQGAHHPVIMGCYGIGLTRVLGTIAELYAGERGLQWPRSVAPYMVHLLLLGEDAERRAAAETLYHELVGTHGFILYDDRDASPGEKLADADLIGLPYRVVVGKTAREGQVEFADRIAGSTVLLGRKDASAAIASKISSAR